MSQSHKKGVKKDEKSIKSFFKYFLYACLIELSTILLAFFCWLCSFSSGEIAYYTALYVIPYLPILFLLKNFNKIEWRIISLSLVLCNAIYFIKILEWFINLI